MPNSRRTIPEHCEHVVRHRAFVTYIIGTTLLACALAGVETVQSLQPRWGTLIAALGDLVLFSFTVELLLRLIAERGHLRRFFSDPWHLFDAAIVGLGYVPYLVPDVGKHSYLVLRAVRIVWAVRLFEELPGLFFVSFLSIGALIFLNLLVGILTDELRASRDAALDRAETERANSATDADVIAEIERLEGSLAQLRERLAFRTSFSSIDRTPSRAE